MKAPLLETRNLKAGYLGREVVQAVNLTVDAGEVVCLLGPNGAGKSTTLFTIAGELAPVDGHRACSTTCRPSRRWTSGCATAASA